MAPDQNYSANLIFETGFLGNPRYLINFPTKRHRRAKSRLEDTEAGLVALVDVIHDRKTPAP